MFGRGRSFVSGAIGKAKAVVSAVSDFAVKAIANGASAATAAMLGLIAYFGAGDAQAVVTLPTIDGLSVSEHVTAVLTLLGGSLAVVIGAMFALHVVKVSLAWLKSKVR